MDICLVTGTRRINVSSNNEAVFPKVNALITVVQPSYAHFMDRAQLFTYFMRYKPLTEQIHDATFSLYLVGPSHPFAEF